MLEDELGPGVAATLARTADQLREDTDLLDDLAATAYDEVRDARRPPGRALADQPPAVLTRVLRLAALDAGSPPVGAVPRARASRWPPWSDDPAARPRPSCPAT